MSAPTGSRRKRHRQGMRSRGGGISTFRPTEARAGPRGRRLRSARRAGRPPGGFSAGLREVGGQGGGGPGGRRVVEVVGEPVGKRDHHSGRPCPRRPWPSRAHLSFILCVRGPYLVHTMSAMAVGIRVMSVAFFVNKEPVSPTALNSLVYRNEVKQAHRALNPVRVRGARPSQNSPLLVCACGVDRCFACSL
jgi:hypothetical protein